MESRVVRDVPELFGEFCAKRFSLLWRGHRDGVRALDFYSHCDGYTNTLTVILNTD
jgi:hypothetical protein